MTKEWVRRWNPKAYWRNTPNFSLYRDDLLAKVLQVVADWKEQKRRVSKARKNLAFFCTRLEMLADESIASIELPPASGQLIEALTDDLADYLSVLPETDCWERHGNQFVIDPDDPPSICEGCAMVAPVRGMSGTHRYWTCDALAFMGAKIVEWRAGFPADPWPEPGVWYSAFETDRSRH
jgi:hypothetical protein